MKSKMRMVYAKTSHASMQKAETSMSKGKRGNNNDKA
jgi:hypothetical protein